MPCRHRIASLAAFGLLALPATPAGAQPAPTFSFSGYGTLGAVRSDNREADYLVDAFRPDGPGRSHRWSTEVDSRLGAQLSATMGSRWSAVVQVIAQQRYDDRFVPVVEWANVKFQATPELAVRAGRVVLPIFMVTDSRRVGYANPWVRPPVEVYSLVPVTSNDGVDASWRAELGASALTLQGTYGRSDSKFPNASGFDAGKAQVRKVTAGVATLERGAATLRANYGEARLTIAAFAPLFDAFRRFGPPGEALAARYDVDDRRVSFLGLGAAYDPGPWFVTGEWARFDTRSVLGRKLAWYASGGMRLGKVTPYATYARLEPDSPMSDPGLPLAALPPAVQPQAAFLNATLDSRLALLPEQRTWSLGMRWDFMRNAALKLQLDDVRPGASSLGTFGNVQAGFAPGTRVRVFSAAVDFVF